MNATGVVQAKDPAIKLFGAKIPVPDKQIPTKQESKDSCNEITRVEMEGPGDDCSGDQDTSSSSTQAKNESQPKVQVNEIQVASEADKDQPENSEMNQEKVFKKPDKVIPCPRCNSMETKFCYFNNYNVNQPRHFCKNCQRYWTAGGTMRNVPIGAGRRKNKHLASHYRQILVSSDGIPISRMENSDSETHQHVSATESVTSSSPTGSGMVLKFGPEAPLCRSMETALNLGDRKRYAGMTSVGSPENGEEPSSSGSSITASSNRINEIHEETMQKEHHTLPKSSNELTSPCPLQFHSVTPWILPWNSGWNNVASVAAAAAASNNSSGQASVPNASQPQWCSGPVLAVPPPNIPLQFIPASYWGCVPIWASGTGHVSLKGSNGGGVSLSSSTSASCCLGSCSPTLGKHSRDFNLPEEEKNEKCIFTPKTLRIDDPNEASKSPFWATLGLIPDQKDATSNGQAGTEGHREETYTTRSKLSMRS